MEKHTERLGSAPLASLLVKLSLPGIAASITTSLYNIVDTFWVAKLGHEAIAALTIVFPYQIIVWAIGMGTGTGIAALVSRKFGEKDITTTNRIMGQIFFLSVLWGALFLLTPLLFARKILAGLGATPDIMVFSETYLVVTSFGAPLIMLIMLVSNLIRGSGDTVKPTIMMVTASILNIILDPFLILGIGPFPAMGIKGAALATVLSQVIGALIGLYFILGNKTTYRFHIKNAVPQWFIIKDIYRVGAPASISQITQSFAFVIFNNVISGYGSLPIAAFGLVMRISDLFFMPIMGVSNALMPVVGYNFGSGNEKRLWQAVKLSTIGIAILLLIGTIILEIWTPGIISIFSSEPELLKIAVPGMRIMLSTLVFIGPIILFITAIQGLSMGGTALFLSLIRSFLLFIPTLYLLNHLFGLTGVWLTLPVADVLGFLVSFTFVYRIYRKRKKALGEKYHLSDIIT